MNDETCKHGKHVWKNYGDGKVRHLTKDGKPTMIICDDKDMYDQPIGFDRCASLIPPGDSSCALHIGHNGPHKSVVHD